MKQLKSPLFIIPTTVAVIFLVLWLTHPHTTEQTTATPSILAALDKQDLELRAKDTMWSDSASKLNTLANAQKDRIIVLYEAWQHSKDKIKTFGTDGNMAFVGGYLEDPTPLKKITITSNDTIIGFTTLHLTNLVEILNDYDYEGTLLDSINAYNVTLVKEKDVLYNQIDGLKQIVATCDLKVLARDDIIKQKDEQILRDKKDAKKRAKRNFFNGLGLGAIGGFIGGLILIL